MKTPLRNPNIASAFYLTFNTKYGKQVLEHLKRTVSYVSISEKNPDPNVALYLSAQNNIISMIENKIKEHMNNHNL